MALGSMSYSQARTCANELNKSASSMDDLFNQLKNEMNSLESVLKSKGADELYSTYKTLESKIGNFPNKVRDFEAFLTSAVEQYEADDARFSNEIR